MRILEDEDIIERFKRGAISDRRFIESMRAVPEEHEENIKEGTPDDNRLVIALENISAILKGISEEKNKTEQKADASIKKGIILRNEKGLIESMRINDKIITLIRNEKGLIESMTVKGRQDGEENKTSRED